MKTTFFAILVLLSGVAMAQPSITYPIPSTALMAGDGQALQSNARYWVCGFGDARVDGSHDILYIDRSGALVLNGDNDTLYTKGGGIITVHGNNNVIYACMCPSIVVDGNDNVINTLANMPVSDQGAGNSRTNINHLYFNYTHAPNGGQCAVVTAVSKPVSTVLVVSPNPAPAGGLLSLSTPSQSAIVLSDALGKPVHVYPVGSSSLSLEGLSTGVYQLSAEGRTVKVVIR